MPPEITDFDKLIYNDSVCMLKESLPYIDITTQKSFAIIIMFMEMENMINIYEHDKERIKKFCKNGSVNDIINTMEKHCSNNNHKNVHKLKQMLNTYKNYEKYKDFLNPDIINSLFNTLNACDLSACSSKHNTHNAYNNPKDNISPDSKKDPENNKNTSDNNQLYNMLFNMMSKEQKELFDTYKSMF